MSMLEGTLRWNLQGVRDALVVDAEAGA